VRHLDQLALITALLGVAVSLFILFGPTVTECVVASGAAGDVGVTGCTTTSLVRSQPIWPMPLLAIVVWGLAPSLALAGVATLTRRGRGLALVYLAVGVELTAVISVAAVLFVPLVLLPLLATAIMATTSTRKTAA
jgi:hypothetical protein